MCEGSVCRGLDTITWVGPLCVPALSRRGNGRQLLKHSLFPFLSTSKVHSDMLIGLIMIQSGAYSGFQRNNDLSKALEHFAGEGACLFSAASAAACWQPHSCVIG